MRQDTGEQWWKYLVKVVIPQCRNTVTSSPAFKILLQVAKVKVLQNNVYYVTELLL